MLFIGIEPATLATMYIQHFHKPEAEEGQLRDDRQQEFSFAVQ